MVMNVGSNDSTKTYAIGAGAGALGGAAIGAVGVSELTKKGKEVTEALKGVKLEHQLSRDVFVSTHAAKEVETLTTKVMESEAVKAAGKVLDDASQKTETAFEALKNALGLADDIDPTKIDELVKGKGDDIVDLGKKAKAAVKEFSEAGTAYNDTMQSVGKKMYTEGKDEYKGIKKAVEDFKNSDVGKAASEKLTAAKNAVMKNKGKWAAIIGAAGLAIGIGAAYLINKNKENKNAELMAAQTPDYGQTPEGTAFSTQG